MNASSGVLDRPDARRLLEDPNAPDLARVRREVVGKRKRLETLAVEYANGNIGKPALVAGTRALNESIETLDRQLIHHNKLVLLPLIGRAAELWDGLDLHRQRAVINALCTITIWPLGKGIREQDPLDQRSHRLAPGWCVRNRCMIGGADAGFHQIPEREIRIIGQETVTNYR